jgi:DNA-binding SARP family transcriptional activator
MGRGYERESPPDKVRGSMTSGVLQLLGGFRLVIDDESVHLPRAEQRLLAILALRDRPQSRSGLAGRLWPDITDARAMGRFRTLLWRLGRSGWRLVDGSADGVELGMAVAVDIQELTIVVDRFLETPNATDGARLLELAGAGELLPEWDEEWLAPERERFRQIRLHALEILAERLTEEGRFARAVEICLAVIADDPMRETARRVLIRVHAAQGNVHDAVLQYLAYRDVMHEEMGLPPSPQMEALIDELGLRGTGRPLAAANGTGRQSRSAHLSVTPP